MSSEVRALPGPESAAALLARSIRFGHRRLAVLRLMIAVDVGARIPEEHWTYCLRAAGALGEPGLLELYRQAVSRANGSFAALSCPEGAVP